MVARIVSGKSIRGAVNYNERKMEQGTAIFLTAENYLKDSKQLTPTERLFALQHRAKLNERVKTNCLHISLNFETSEKINVAKMQDIARDYMQQIGFGMQPYLVYRHQDAAHPHCHIVTTNINPEGQRISLHNLGRGLSEKARQDIEIKYGLIQAKGRGSDDLSPVSLKDLQKADYGKEETKKSITQIVNAVVTRYNYSSLAELNAVLGRFNILADRGHEKSGMFSQKGLLYRILDENGNKLGVPIKASRIAGQHTLSSLEKRFEKNKTKRKFYSASLKQRLDRVLQTRPDRKEFEEKLAEQKIDILYRTSKEGQVYGITYIDHAGRSVFNGSELGKAYSARQLLEGFKKAAELQSEVLTRKQPSSGTAYPSQPRPLPKALLTKQEVPATNYLDILLTKAEPDYSPAFPRKRKKRKRKAGQQITL